MRCNNYTIPMRMKLYTLLCISFFLLFTACNQDDDPVPPEKVSRTVLVYIMADNSLSNYASLDIDEMMVGMAAVDASDNNLLVYVDDNSREGSPSYNPPTLFRLSKDKSGTVLKEVVREYKEQVSTDASVMEEVMKHGIVTLVKLVQPTNASEPILITLLGMLYIVLLLPAGY